jgi:hypothetical protein
MSNTKIQIKRSSINIKPVDGSLGAAEPAYSYLSDKLFLGTSDGSGVIAIGGKFFVDQQNAIYDLVNAAYTSANAGFTDANAIFNLLNLAFDTTNSAYTLANANFDVTNAAYTMANANYAVTNIAFDTVNSAYGLANSNYDVTNAAYTLANANFDVTNAAYTLANANFDVANAAYGYANASNSWADSTFVKLTLPGEVQTITSDIAITGNLTFVGNATTIQTTTLEVDDTLIYLGANNYSGTDLLDIGIVANYGNTTGANVHTGLYRDHASKEWYLFQGYDIEPSSNNIITPYSNNMVNAVLNADLVTSNLWLGGANAIVWISSAYDNSNGGFGLANAAYGATNSAFGVINAAYTMANANYTVTNAAYTLANANFDVTNAAYTLANANFDVTNAAYTAVNAAYVVVNAAYTSSNAGYTVANAAFGTANTADRHAANASYVNTGTLLVNYGGTGRNSFTTNGVIYGNGTDGLLVTSSGSEGNVLQVNSSGVPQFGMLDGGTF